MNSSRTPVYFSLSHIKSILVGVLSLAFFPTTFAQAPLPTIEGNLLKMPVVVVLGTPYSIDWQLVQTNGLVDLLLHQFSAVSQVDTTGAPSFDGTVLNLPKLMVAGVSYWAEFTVDSTQPVIFRLQNASVNDAGSSGIAGKWRITSQVNATACGEGTYNETFTLTVTQQGSTIKVKSSVGEFTANLQGTSLQWNGNYNEDGGTVSSAIDTNFSSSLNSLTGSSVWTWSNSSTTCNGSSTFSGVLLHN